MSHQPALSLSALSADGCIDARPPSYLSAACLSRSLAPDSEASALEELSIGNVDAFASPSQEGAHCPAELDLPLLPRLCALCIDKAHSLVWLSATRAPRLRWITVTGYPALRKVDVDCAELVRLGVDGPSGPVHVSSRCKCPLMGRGEADLQPWQPNPGAEEST